MMSMKINVRSLQSSLWRGLKISNENRRRLVGEKIHWLIPEELLLEPVKYPYRVDLLSVYPNVITTLEAPHLTDTYISR